jgi:excisionase family DNA binding protein
MVSRTADNSEPGRQLISLETAAKQLDCSTRTVRRLISSGQLTGLHIGVGGRLLRIPQAEVDTIGTPIRTAG